MDDSFEHEVRVRYSDLDTYGHVNNAVYGTYCEEARSAWVEATLGIDDMDAFSTVLVSLDLDFYRPVEGRGTVTVAVDLLEVGESSFTLAYELRHGGEVVAEGESTQVHIDRERGESRPIPAAWREAMLAAADCRRN